MNCCPYLTKFAGLLAGLLAVGALFLADSKRPSAADQDGKLLRHVVLFQFKETSSQEEIQHVIDEFRALPKKISTIADFEYGTNNSPEGLADGFTHCFLLSFKSEKDRETYLPHPAHKAFGQVLKPHLEKVTVVDYWAAK